jgi:putative restriction endonuclease
VNEAQILGYVQGLVRHSSGGSRAPHKPLTLLLALGRVSRGEARLVRFEEIEELLRRLLAEYGRPTDRRPHPEYPFYRLGNDAGGALWEVPERQLLADVATASGDPPLSTLRDAHGGFAASVDAYLREHPRTLQAVAGALLEEFPASLREDLCDAVGLQWQAFVDPGRVRDPAFRGMILRIYEGRCAVCGYDGRLGGANLGIEAAHVLWHAYGGPDQADNGVALCSFHHTAFDRGAIGLDDDRRVMVSQHLSGAETHGWLTRFIGAPLNGPMRGEAPVSERNARWHRENVFRDPARAA